MIRSLKSLSSFNPGVTPKGVALLMNGLPGLRHVVYDTMSDVLTYVDFNTSDSVAKSFGLRTVLFHSMELLSSNHLELVRPPCNASGREPIRSYRLCFYRKHDLAAGKNSKNLTRCCLFCYAYV